MMQKQSCTRSESEKKKKEERNEEEGKKETKPKECVKWKAWRQFDCFTPVVGQMERF
jgi:hypothetical protein